MQYILVIEDDLAISDLIAYNLKQEKLGVYTAASGEDGLKLAFQKRPDLIVLDLMLPGINGLEVCRRIRSDDRTRTIPVIMLTARSEEVDRVVGFEVGADDYVTKPFSPRELVLRVKAVLKRAEKDSVEKERTIVFKDMVLEPSRHSVKIGKKELELTLIEFKLLRYLLENREKVVSRDTILNSVWGYSADVFSRTVDTHVTRLREKLGTYSKYLRSVRGIGYSWKVR